MMFRNMSVSSLGVFMVVYLVDVRGFELTLATGALALYELAGVAGALLGGTLSDRFGRRRMVMLSAIFTSVFMLIFVHVEGALLIPVLLALGVTSLSVTPVFQALVQDQLPDNRAMANGMFILYAFGARAINVLIAGALGDALGLHNAFIIAALISLLALPIIFTLPATPGVRHEDILGRRTSLPFVQKSISRSASSLSTNFTIPSVVDNSWCSLSCRMSNPWRGIPMTRARPVKPGLQLLAETANVRREPGGQGSPRASTQVDKAINSVIDPRKRECRRARRVMIIFPIPITLCNVADDAFGFVSPFESKWHCGFPVCSQADDSQYV